MYSKNAENYVNGSFHAENFIPDVIFCIFNSLDVSVMQIPDEMGPEMVCFLLMGGATLSTHESKRRMS